MNLTPDQLTWLSANKSSYELILLHAILHDKSRRMAMLGIPLGPQDFESPAAAAILQGLILAEAVMARMEVNMPFPPSVDHLRTYMYAATKETSTVIAEDELDGGYKMLEELQDPRRQEHWYFLDTYFTAWLSSARAKVYARRAQVTPITDAQLLADSITRDLRRASAAIYTQEGDDMYQAIYGTAEEGKVRRPTGFPAIDEALNGGWGEGECYGLMSPTGGGKSICAGQTGYYNALTKGYTLILSTELPVVEYITRMISNACNIKINLIQDCLNVGQIRRMIAAADPPAISRLELALEVIMSRIRIVKLHPDQGLNARAIMEQQVDLFEQQMGHKPTLVIFDWLGRIADQGGAGKQSDRTFAWELAADSCVQFSEVSGIPSLILLQTVNNAGSKMILTQEDTGISKGVWKQMVMGFAITATIDTAAIKQALLSGGDHSVRTIPNEQRFCVIKARKGEGTIIPVKRQFLYQRFQSGTGDRR